MVLMSDTGMQGLNYGGFGDRTAAYIIDTIIIAVFVLGLFEGAVSAGLFNGTAVTQGGAQIPFIIGAVMVGLVLMILLCWLYSAGMTSLFGGTLGKRIMGMEVIDFAGDRLSFFQASVRFFAKILSGFILGIGFFMIRYSEERQGLHDRFAGTFVVYRKKGTPAPANMKQTQ
jgi:uncharacterized RDD family membrane protein YckC